MKDDNKGSFTVEAALALPIFVFTVLAFIFLFRMILMQVQLQGALTEAAAELSGSAYLTKQLQGDEEKDDELLNSIKLVGGKIATGAVVRKYFVKEPCFSNMLSNGISYVSSSYLEEDETIDLVAKYTIEIPIPIISLCGIPIIQRVKTRAYVGTDKLLSGDAKTNDARVDNEEYVYVTETGVVYHTSLECSSLKLSISECMMTDISKKRNVYGGCYKPCEKCCQKGKSVSLVYICSDGDAYHNELNCSGLKRTIHRQKRSEVETHMRVCSKCGG